MNRTWIRIKVYMRTCFIRNETSITRSSFDDTLYQWNAVWIVKSFYIKDGTWKFASVDPKGRRFFRRKKIRCFNSCFVFIPVCTFRISSPTKDSLLVCVPQPYIYLKLLKVIFANFPFFSPSQHFPSQSFWNIIAPSLCTRQTSF